MVRTEIDGLYMGDRTVRTETLTAASVVAFAGIAKPERFFAALGSIGIRPVRCVSFRDHHYYSRHEIENLAGDILVTTEKDAVRLETVTNRPYCYLRISAKIADFDALMSLIMSRLPKS